MSRATSARRLRPEWVRLAGMRERVAFVDGELDETAPGAGTILRVQLPAVRQTTSHEIPAADAR